MGFTIKEGMVRIDCFCNTGKWYDTLEVDMSSYYNLSFIHDVVKYSLILSAGNDEFVDNWLAQGGYFVCLEPYHKYSHPVMLKSFTPEKDD